MGGYFPLLIQSPLTVYDHAPCWKTLTVRKELTVVLSRDPWFFPQGLVEASQKAVGRKTALTGGGKKLAQEGDAWFHGETGKVSMKLGRGTARRQFATGSRCRLRRQKHTRQWRAVGLRFGAAAYSPDDVHGPRAGRFRGPRHEILIGVYRQPWEGRYQLVKDGGKLSSLRRGRRSPGVVGGIFT